MTAQDSTPPKSLQTTTASTKQAAPKGKPRAPIALPDGHDRLLLHSCCAPCSGEIMEALVNSGINFSIFFYNPNIHPRAEYQLRKEENVRFAEKHHIPFIDADYDSARWFERARGMEHEPERGIRCTMCFDMRFDVTAQYAAEHGFTLFSSSLGISRWKNMDQINASGLQAAQKQRNLSYWTFNWRKGGGSSRMIDIAKQERFYQQEYCGCAYSLRDSNRHRLSQGRPRIALGKLFYAPDEAPKNAIERSSPPAPKP